MTPKKRNSRPADVSYVVRPLTADEGGGYLCEIVEFPGCLGDGETPAAAIADAKSALKAWTKTAAEFGDDRPAGSSGQWRLRVPKSLHRRLHERARVEGVSLNTLAVSMLSEGLAGRTMAIDRNARKSATAARR
ncbi:MAG: toxin-antitoxin system HicB family antitoxin [Rhodospirillaceae bacterium]|nr:toxin-antitoxin system HicB family antitoxin [Rhodospirillaceae bacterium]